MTPEELVAHYAEQLSVQGWQPDAAVGYDSLAYQSWLLIDEFGTQWHGLMLVLASSRGEDQREVELRITRLADP